VDVLSWIALIVVALMVVAVALSWLLTEREYDHHGHWFRYARRTLGGVLVVGFLLLTVEVFTTNGAKEVVFDGWLDSVADSIDGTSDRDERLARDREGTGRGYFTLA
jgi:high-affinity Fe2+/Pb2+ permease